MRRPHHIIATVPAIAGTASVSASSGAALAIPRGWRLIPVEATTDMLLALYRVEPGNARPAFDRMLEVAPRHPSDTDHA